MADHITGYITVTTQIYYKLTPQVSARLFFFIAFLLIIGGTDAPAQQLVPAPPDTQAIKSPLDHEVIYHASDSMRFDIREQKVYLFGNARVDYGSIRLTAAYMVFNSGEKIVEAYGTTDSLGKAIGLPVFKERDSEIRADTIRYNFETKTGIIKEVRTQEGDGFLLSERTKRHPDEHIHVEEGRYTTCEHEEPHYYFRMKKAIVIPNNKILAQNINLKIADIPTPVWVPFAYFPNKKGEAAGILIPTYGESPALGFFLLNGGWYWPVNHKLDTRITGDIYSRGSWGLKSQTNYKFRYRYSGAFNLSYNVLKTSDPEFPDYRKTTAFFIRWSHNQDPKARPNSRFSANVNAGSSENFRNNFNSSINDFLTNTFQSNISWSKTFPNQPYALSVNLRHNQNTLSRKVSLTLPEAAFNVNRFYPGKAIRNRFAKAGSTTHKWYEQIGVTYQTNFRNELHVGDSVIRLNNTDALSDSLRMGLRHNVSVTTALSDPKLPFTITPHFNLTERWYFKTVNKRWNNELQALVIDTIPGFDRNMEWNLSAFVSSKIYGFFTLKNGPVIRHVMTPNVGFTYRPDFGTNRTIFTQQENPITYSPYEIGIYGVPVSGESGRVNMSLLHNLETKFRSDKDTTTGFVKIKVIDNFSMNTHYDLFKETNKWSDLTMSGRTRLFKKLNLNFSGLYDPYDYDTTGMRIDNSHWSKTNGWGSLRNISLAMSAGLKSKQGSRGDLQSDKGTARELEHINSNPEAYIDFNVPWSLNMNYNLRFNKRFINGTDSFTVTQTFNFSGELSLTPKWKIGFSSGYDFVNKGFTNNTSINVYRDLHCWDLSFNYIPFGFQKSYNIQLNVKSAMLQDLKLARRRSWYDNQP